MRAWRHRGLASVPLQILACCCKSQMSRIDMFSLLFSVGYFFLGSGNRWGTNSRKSAFVTNGSNSDKERERASEKLPPRTARNEKVPSLVGSFPFRILFECVLVQS